MYAAIATVIALVLLMLSEVVRNAARLVLLLHAVRPLVRQAYRSDGWVGDVVQHGLVVHYTTCAKLDKYIALLNDPFINLFYIFA